MESSAVIAVYKPLGVTPLAALRRLQEAKPELARATLGYAGRLDPMAEGVLLILVNTANRNRKIYERLPKTYAFSLVFGMTTDSYDILGLVRPGHPAADNPERRFPEIVSRFIGTFRQPYPPFSAVRVNGKPLFAWARTGQLPESIPAKPVTVTELTLVQSAPLSAPELRQYVLDRLATVFGNFRQDEIRAGWDRFFTTAGSRMFHRASGTVHCSGGCYVRSLVHEIGQALGTGAVTLSITRTAVGAYGINDCVTV